MSKSTGIALLLFVAFVAAMLIKMTLELSP